MQDSVVFEVLIPLLISQALLWQADGWRGRVVMRLDGSMAPNRIPGSVRDGRTPERTLFLAWFLTQKLIACDPSTRLQP